MSSTVLLLIQTATLVFVNQDCHATKVYTTQIQRNTNFLLSKTVQRRNQIITYQNGTQK